MPGSMASMQLDVSFGNWDAPPSAMSAGDVVTTGLSENFEKSVQAGSSAVRFVTRISVCFEEAPVNCQLKNEFRVKVL